MAKLVLPVVGATVGFFVAGPTGAQWGWAIGAAASSVLLAPDQEGPRLNDLAAGGSSYGTGIPICYGTTKVPGNVIWASDLIETKNSESAKGGPEINTYTYSQHVQVLVCAGPVAGIRKIWANGRLIYDMSTANTATSGYSGNIRVYTGTTTQTADSLIESFKGAGNVPGHRGYCHVVFESLQLEDYGNRTPSFEFEVVASGAASYGLSTVIAAYPVTQGSTLGQDTAVVLPGGRFAVAEQITGGYIAMYIIDGNGTLLGQGVSSVTTAGINDTVAYVSSINEVWIPADSRGCLRFDADTGTYIGAFDTGQYYNTTIAYCEATDVVVVVVGPLHDGMKFFRPGIAAPLAYIAVHGWETVFRFLTDDAQLWTDAASSWQNSLQLFDAAAAYGPSMIISSSVLTRSSKGIGNELAYDSVRRRVIWTNSDSLPNLAIIDIDTLQVTHTTTNASYANNLYYNPATDYFYSFGSPGGGETSIITIDPDTLQKVNEHTVTSGGAPNVTASIMPSGLPGDYLMSRTGAGLVKTPISPRLSANQVALSSIVSDLCTRAGLTASDIDVTGLTDMVDGYKTT